MVAMTVCWRCDMPMNVDGALVRCPRCGYVYPASGTLSEDTLRAMISAGEEVPMAGVIRAMLRRRCVSAGHRMRFALRTGDPELIAAHRRQLDHARAELSAYIAGMSAVLDGQPWINPLAYRE